MNLTLVSKKVYKDFKRPGVEWKIIPTIDIIPQQYQGNDSMQAWMLTYVFIYSRYNIRLTIVGLPVPV
mgnify:FL=1